ncbi:zf-HC2 domain-containing protein [Alkalinema sp. FACHB-956]|uniref:anti-sigma factor family protein n=1 Tax=Alkalinema sp. FACHB-956 TaxID=2692768 RepID=UPI001686AFB1|nr:zf-HC2 domain-containing protein [Alkalinema sp. FACHB-956]MBD2327449.1 zf-HC2 domain-containing protein [Alkalinema sp. FACHB-956]
MLSAPNEFPESGRGVMNIQRDRFELLSAYLDGEVTADERRQVESWLAEDAKMQQLHQRLVKLRQGFQSLPAPQPVQPIDQTIEQVMQKVDRRPRLTVLWGGGMAAAAAVAVAMVSNLTPMGYSPQMANNANKTGKTEVAKVAPQSPSVAETTSSPAAPSDNGLLVALDQPVLVISKSAVADDNGNGSVRNADIR